MRISCVLKSQSSIKTSFVLSTIVSFEAAGFTRKELPLKAPVYIPVIIKTELCIVLLATVKVACPILSFSLCSRWSALRPT